jgi:hypothetical protein
VTPYEVIFGKVFGSGTNAAVRASADTGTQEIFSDSQLIALISSLGIIVAVPVVARLSHFSVGVGRVSDSGAVGEGGDGRGRRGRVCRRRRVALILRG